MSQQAHAVADTATGGVAAVDRAFAIVAAISDSTNAMSLAELSRATGFYKSTILRLIASLERAAIVVRRPDDKYELGPLAFRLGRAYDRTLQVNERVRSALESLVAQGTESASFHMPYNDECRLCLLRVDSDHPTLDSVKQGDLLPADRGAPADIINRFSSYSGGEPVPDNDLVCTSFGARDKACGAIACPVFSAGDRFVGALSLSGPQERFTRETVASMSALLLQQARSLSRSLGGQWPAEDREGHD